MKMQKIFNRLLHGKSYEKANLEKKLKISNESSYFYFFFSLIVFALAVLSLTSNFVSTHIQTRNTRVIYDNISFDEQSFAKEALFNTKSEYADYQKSVTFTNDLSKYYKGLGATDNVTLLNGFNDHANIYVLDNVETEEYCLAERLCHEMLHTFSLSDENSHKIVYDTASYLICYNDKFRIKLLNDLKSKYPYYRDLQYQNIRC